MTQPALFVSHGAPSIVLDPSPARGFLEKLSQTGPRPDAILVVSAHWETATPTVSSATTPETIYDFGGFPDALRRIVYAAPGAPELAERVSALLTDAGFGPVAMANRGLDHGAWVPLYLGFPAADIPVTQLSIQPHRDPAYHFRLGEALQSLRADNVLILASGSLTHDLASFQGQAVDDPAPDWVSAFADWIAWAVAEGRADDVLDYRARAPHAVRNHPTDEHLLPLFVALGAGATACPGRHLHKSTTHGVLAMDAFAFG